MDLGFRRLEPSGAEVMLAPLDYQRLVASLAAMQASSRTASTEARLTIAGSAAHPVMMLVLLLDGGPGWVEAAAMLEGAFHPGLAARNLAPRPEQDVTALFTSRS